MRKLRALWMRLRVLLAGRSEDGEFDAELESHVAMHVEDGVRAGMSAEEARRQALLRLGGAEQTRQAYRERRTLPWLENVVRDVRYALRGFRRNPVFTITAIVCARANAESITARAQAAVIGFFLLAPGGPILVGALKQILVLSVGGVCITESGKLKAQSIAARRQA